MKYFSRFKGSPFFHCATSLCRAEKKRKTWLSNFSWKRWLNKGRQEINKVWKAIGINCGTRCEWQLRSTFSGSFDSLILHLSPQTEKLLREFQDSIKIVFSFHLAAITVVVTLKNLFIMLFRMKLLLAVSSCKTSSEMEGGGRKENNLLCFIKAWSIMFVFMLRTNRKCSHNVTLWWAEAKMI